MQGKLKNRLIPKRGATEWGEVRQRPLVDERKMRFWFEQVRGGAKAESAGTASRFWANLSFENAPPRSGIN
jgi:hypothetical protein